MTPEQFLAKMSDREKAEYHTSQHRMSDEMERRKKEALRVHEEHEHAVQESLLEKAERGMYGNMTRVQLQEAHSELDHWSKGHS